MSTPAEAPSAPPAPARPTMPPMCYACGRHLTPEQVKCPDCGAPVRSARGQRAGFDRLRFAALVLGLLALIGAWGGVSALLNTDELPASGPPILENDVDFTGSVFNETNAPLAGVRIWFTSASNATQNETVSGPNGTFSFLDVPTGYREFHFEKENHTTVKLRTYLVNNEQTRVHMRTGNGTDVQDHATFRNVVLGINFCGSLMLGAAILAVAGAIACYRRRNYGLALSAAIVSFLVVPVMILAAVLSILAIVLVVRSKRDFR